MSFTQFYYLPFSDDCSFASQDTTGPVHNILLFHLLLCYTVLLYPL